MVTPGFHPIKGGTETVVRNLSIELNRIGVHTDVMTFNMDRKYAPKWKGKIEKIDGVTVFKIPALNWLPIKHSPRITLGVNLIPGRFTNLLREYDIIHFHEVDFSFPLFSFFVKKPKIFHLHGINVDFFKRYHLSRIIFKQVADYYITITRQMGRDLTELGITANRIIYLPNAINTRVFCPKKEKEEKLILFVGRITHGKGIHVLLKSLRYLTDSIQLVVIGPSDWDTHYYKNILTMITKINNDGKHKIMYLGALDQTEIIDWYKKASILVSPSFSEGLPVVILEAMSCETPVIASPVGGIPEIVQNFKNGILVPSDNPLKLAEAIQYLVDNKDIRTKLGQEGRNMVVENFSLETIVKKLFIIYQKLINNSPS
jgi:glycosyltransferase involved in cell wall biosynthesis